MKLLYCFRPLKVKKDQVLIHEGSPDDLPPEVKPNENQPENGENPENIDQIDSEEKKNEY